ncbi:MAG: hypothetical protein EXS00_05255 [Phycisphaerales bacterium]|nr:hypothetical protein [Phycisphaerales bacterium]
MGTTLAAVISTSAYGQMCDPTPPAGSLHQSDNDVCGGAGDANGGCNYAPSLFQDLGHISAGGSVAVDGTMGTFIPAGAADYTSRDLDWFTIHTTEYGTISCELSTIDVATGIELANTVMFIANGEGVSDPCMANFVYGQQVPGCPHVGSAFVGPGTHMVIVSTPFEDADALTPPIYACANYVARISFAGLNNPTCAASVGDCAGLHGSTGCDWPECCEVVCNFSASCCDTAWDQICVDLAESECGLFEYSCPDVAGAPGNDCAIMAQLVTAGGTAAFNTISASTDGPNGYAAECAVDIGNDVWFISSSPAAGQMTVNVCDAFAGAAIDVFYLGQDSSLLNPSDLRYLRIGCWNGNCGTVGNGAAVTIIDMGVNDHLLVRVGGVVDAATGVAASGAGTIGFEFLGVLFSTGVQKYVIATATGAGTNLGLSSGYLSATSPKRWLAQAFVLPAAQDGFSKWTISAALAKGFMPAGVTNEFMSYHFWKRLAGNPAPNGGVAPGPTNSFWIASGSVPYPVGFDDANDGAANASHLFDLAAPIELDPGNYYFTVYASNSAGTAANFAWFIYSPDGINLVDATGVFAWRSANYPTPGFVRYTLAGYTVQPGDDPLDLFNCAFQLLGVPSSPVAAPCYGDFDGDGIRGGGDLAMMLGAWGSPGGDLDGNGTTDGGDLAGLLSVFNTACP